jgi:hypothetical protein
MSDSLKLMTHVLIMSVFLSFPKALIGNPVIFNIKDFWIPTFANSRFLKHGDDNNSDFIDNFARGSIEYSIFREV